MADPFARNPALDDLRVRMPEMRFGARPGAPTLFASGDLPPFTASGNDPKALLALPWKLRHAAAKADQATWARMFDMCADVPDGDLVAELEFPREVNDPANAEYADRVRAWASNTPISAGKAGLH